MLEVFCSFMTLPPANGLGGAHLTLLITETDSEGQFGLWKKTDPKVNPGPKSWLCNLLIGKFRQVT